MERESFIFYKSFYDSIKELAPEEQVQIYDAIFKYQFEAKEIELKGICKSIFTLIIPQLKANNKSYLNGLKGGAPKGNQNATKKQPKNNLDSTKKQPNENENENENENVNDKYIILVEQVINYMNELAGTSFKTTTKKTQTAIKARLKEGFTVEELKDVVYSKYHEWFEKPIKFQNGVMSDKYYRPDTLFGTKFESYLENYKRDYV